ncbi:MAG: hypothetical protein MSA90_21930 [Faecalicatena sp.]|uniref:hypothetical protein n=1 Tax=Faecalicatena sp. TaxID=2005360 RepID=UPI0025845778|nr:hypothetical protein [Faecalicatena sp.]MCI6468110.1 hypothetical protein [Faecalicatena sp.]MDY4670920.1 hypothetical protein [Oliverpabstia sp.]MDY5620363.1 hypothetical protein [Lachnospiraceae bacterium]
MVEEIMNEREFKTLMRFMLQDIQDAKEERDSKKKDELLDKIADKIQKSLED